jgi:hypothetical protein
MQGLSLSEFCSKEQTISNRVILKKWLKGTIPILSYIKHESYQISAAFLFDEFGIRNSCVKNIPDSEARTI